MWYLALTSSAVLFFLLPSTLTSWDIFFSSFTCFCHLTWFSNINVKHAIYGAITLLICVNLIFSICNSPFEQAYIMCKLLLLQNGLILWTSFHFYQVRNYIPLPSINNSIKVSLFYFYASLSLSSVSYHEIVNNKTFHVDGSRDWGLSAHWIWVQQKQVRQDLDKESWHILLTIKMPEGFHWICSHSLGNWMFYFQVTSEGRHNRKNILPFSQNQD